jgi:hypothetical protein
VFVYKKVDLFYNKKGHQLDSFCCGGLDGTNIIFDGRFLKIGLPDIRAVPVRYVKFSIDVMVDERNIA